MQTIMKGLWKTSGWLVMAAALSFGFASCSSDNDAVAEQQSVKPTGKYTMTVQVTKGDADTRALKLGTDGTSVDAYWTEGEIVEVYQNQNGETLLGTLTAAASDGITTTLTGTLEVAPLAGEALYFYLHARDRSGRYTSQNGTLASIAENQDFAEGVVQPYDENSAPNGFTIHGTQVNVPSLTLESKQAIVKFTLLDAQGNPLKVRSLTVTDEALNLSSQSNETPSFISGAPLTITPDDATNELYVAISGLNKEDKHSHLVLTATDADNNNYIYAKEYAPEASVYFTHGKYYTRTVKMKKGFTTFRPSDVIKVGDPIRLTQEWKVYVGDTQWGYFPRAKTGTLVRANIDDSGKVTEAEDGAYYVIKVIYHDPNDNNHDNDYNFYFFDDKSMPVLATPDGLVVKNVDINGTKPTCTIGVNGDYEVWNWKSGEGLPSGDFDDYSPNNGVKLSGKNAMMDFYDGLVYLMANGPDASGTSFTFEAPKGKKFVEIKMIFKTEEEALNAHFDSSGWHPLNNTWICHPFQSSKVTIKPGYYTNTDYHLAIDRIESIVFTLAYDPNNN